MTDEPVSNTGTFSSSDSSLPEITSEDMRKLVLEMTREPFLKDVRCDRWAWARIRAHLDAEYWVNQKRFGLSKPDRAAVDIYATGTPVFIDDTFEIGQWKAIDTDGNVMAEGNLLLPHL